MAGIRNAAYNGFQGCCAVRDAASTSTELFWSDLWEFNDDPRWLTVSLVFGAINLLYVVMFLAGWGRSGAIFGIGLFVFFVLLRSAFLGSLENPEPRYTLECYPAVLLLASGLFHRAE